MTIGSIGHPDLTGTRMEWMQVNGRLTEVSVFETDLQLNVDASDYHASSVETLKSVIEHHVEKLRKIGLNVPYCIRSSRSVASAVGSQISGGSKEPQ